MSTEKETARARNWATVAYPENLREDWLTALKDEHIPAFVSPLHDSDKNADGEDKKPHYHILFMFAGNKTKAQVQKISDEILSGVLVQKCKDLRGYARYLCHLDNPEKAQYTPASVVSLGGADYLEMVGSLADTDTAVREMMTWCREQGIYSFARLCDYAANERSDWFRILTSKRTVFITSYLKSLQWEHKQEVDDELARKTEAVANLQKQEDALRDDLRVLSRRAEKMTREKVIHESNEPAPKIERDGFFAAPVVVVNE